jgi:hypothetical protein
LNADFKIGTDFFNLNSVGFDEIGNRGGGSVQGSNNIGGLVESATNVHNLNQYFTLNASKSSVILLYQDRLELIITIGLILGLEV